MREDRTPLQSPKCDICGTEFTFINRRVGGSCIEVLNGVVMVAFAAPLSSVRGSDLQRLRQQAATGSHGVRGPCAGVQPLCSRVQGRGGVLQTPPQAVDQWWVSLSALPPMSPNNAHCVY